MLMLYCEGCPCTILSDCLLRLLLLLLQAYNVLSEDVTTLFRNLTYAFTLTAALGYSSVT